MVSIVFLSIQLSIIIKRKKLIRTLKKLKRDDSLNKDKIKEIELTLNEIDEKYYNK
ncbi:UNVERIFIED_CONTAM: hypothetical protein O8I53_13665 [Campylobacter lari]